MRQSEYLALNANKERLLLKKVNEHDNFLAAAATLIVTLLAGLNLVEITVLFVKVI